MANASSPFDEANKEIAFKLEVLNVQASFWGAEHSQEEIEKEARRRLKENQGIDYPEKKK